MDTTPQGSGPLDVNSASNVILGLMGEPEGDEPTPDDPSLESQGDTEQEVEEPQRFRVKAAGEEREVSLDDLIKSYQLGTDYTQKTQALAEQRKAVEAERSAVEQAKQLRDQYAQRLELIETVLTEQNKPENLEALKETDPIGYAMKVAEQVQRDKQIAAVNGERQRLAEKQHAERSAQAQQYLAEQHARLSQVIPEFADPQKSQEIRKDIRTYAQGMGFTEQELNQVYDSRAVQVLWEAAQFRKLMAQKPEVTKKVAEAPKTLKPGAGKVVNNDLDAMNKDMARLRKSGNTRDAAALFERLT